MVYLSAVARTNISLVFFWFFLKYLMASKGFSLFFVKNLKRKQITRVLSDFDDLWEKMKYIEHQEAISFSFFLILSNHEIYYFSPITMRSVGVVVSRAPACCYPWSPSSWSNFKNFAAFCGIVPCALQDIAGHFLLKAHRE